MKNSEFWEYIKRGGALCSIFFWWILVGILIMNASASEGAELEYFGFESSRIYNEREPFLPDYTLRRQQHKGKGDERWNHRQAALFNLSLLKLSDTRRIFWDNEVYGQSTSRQYRMAGWEFDFGIQVDQVDLFWHHHSRHQLDGDVDQSYPLHDRYGIRIHFWGRK